MTSKRSVSSLRAAWGVGLGIHAEKGADVVSVDLSQRRWEWQQPNPTCLHLLSTNTKNYF